ncbi:TPA: hypothetical protein OT983_003918 [Citrobacter freundii]|uniref:Uncharacterized protein n=2 Tax=Citrobacter TaxID=544 RepID=A0AAN4JD32_CITFR|nr:hypothetical protein [Salmonella enterica subsp. enterica serovar Minnesota]EKT9260634.1 hypothetical protein [Citrobacter freundii]ELG4518942.1 hypothetical protein [Escherichia coli]ELW1293691.1 hypothetical protein [Salmonella enterica]HBC5490140.1 hypothetical protein [Klebsiella oxytoca]HCD1254276.1 hypothetical protein [Citrobacter amalonaticus]
MSEMPVFIVREHRFQNLVL